MSSDSVPFKLTGSRLGASMVGRKTLAQPAGRCITFRKIDSDQEGPMRGSMLQRRYLAITVWLIIIAGGVAAPASAQEQTGAIAGIITDQTGAALPGTTITVVNLATGQSRTVVSLDNGFYRVTALQPSRYTVTAELAGFSTIKRSDVPVNIGSVTDLNLTLRLGNIEESVTVSGESPLIESSKTALSSVITQDTIESLPSRNRQYLDFALLLPASTESVTRIQGTGAVVGGARSKEGSLLVDGFYNLDETFAMPKTRHSQDAIQEFQVVTFGGAAEYGRAIGGVINAVTKSGGNKVQGSGYGFFRNKNLNEQDFAEKRLGRPKSDFSRQQWGGSLGGPLKENKSFFFGAYERTSEDIPFDNGITPENGALLGLPPADVGIVLRFLRLNFAMGKWNHNLSDNQRVEAAYTFGTQTDHDSSQPEPFTTRSAASNHLVYKDHSVFMKWTAIANEGRLLHELKGSYSPRFYTPGGYNLGGPPLAPDGQINVGNLTNSSAPRVTITNVAIFGSGGFQGDTATYPIQTIYTATLFKDKHQIKVGGDYLYSHLRWAFFSALTGKYNFASLANFQRGLYSTYTQTFGDVSNPRSHQYISGFAQDSWQANKRLTLNYGLRYDLELNPTHPKSGLAFGNDSNNFGPRFALSYDLTDRGRTFVKMSSGVYYDKLWQNMTGFFTALKGYEQTTAVTYTPTTAGAPAYPNVFPSLPANVPRSVVNVSIMPEKVNVPRSAQVIGTIEHTITANTVISGSVIYTKSANKEYTLDTNLQWNGTTWVRPDASYRSINQLRFESPAEYRGGFIEITRRGQRIGFEGNLTFARSWETPTAAGGINGSINDQRCGILCDYGPAADVPAVRGLVSGWYNVNPHVQVSGIFRARSGLALDPTAAGLDLNGDQKFGDRTPGLDPFSFRGPGMNALDARVAWMVPLGGARRLHMYVESFNLLNQANVAVLNNNYGPIASQPLVSWLQPQQYFPPREIQLGARFTF
jgi:hypothetical protein